MGWANRLRMLLQKLTSDDLLFLFVSFFFSEGGGFWCVYQVGILDIGVPACGCCFDAP